MTQSISGFLLLRRPQHNYDMDGHLQSPRQAPQIDGIFYGGIERMPWRDLEQAYRDRSLSDEALVLREELMKSNAADRDVMLLQDYGKTKALLAALRDKISRLEICAVYSQRLSNVKGHVRTDLEIDWLGVDPFCGGYGSMILQGLFTKPELFADFIPDVARTGLFEDGSAFLEKYIEQYVRLEGRHNLELFEPVLEHLDRIRVGRVC